MRWTKVAGILQLLPAINIEESSKNIGAKQLNMLLFHERNI